MSVSFPHSITIRLDIFAGRYVSSPPREIFHICVSSRKSSRTLLIVERLKFSGQKSHFRHPFRDRSGARSTSRRSIVIPPEIAALSAARSRLVDSARSTCILLDRTDRLSLAGSLPKIRAGQRAPISIGFIARRDKQPGKNPPADIASIHRTHVAEFISRSRDCYRFISADRRSFSRAFSLSFSLSFPIAILVPRCISVPSSLPSKLYISSLFPPPIPP